MTESGPKYSVLNEGQSFEEKSSLQHLIYNFLVSTQVVVSILSVAFFIYLGISSDLIILSLLGALLVGLGCLLSSLAKSRLDEKKQTIALVLFCLAGAHCLLTSVVSMDMIVMGSKTQPFKIMSFFGNNYNGGTVYNSGSNSGDHYSGTTVVNYGSSSNNDYSDSNVYNYGSSIYDEYSDSNLYNYGYTSNNHYYGSNVQNTGYSTNNNNDYSDSNVNNNGFSSNNEFSGSNIYNYGYTSGNYYYGSTVRNTAFSTNNNNDYDSSTIYNAGYSRNNNNDYSDSTVYNSGYYNPYSYELARTHVSVGSFDRILTLTLFPIQAILFVALIYQAYQLRFTLREKKRLALELDSSMLRV